ncbi:uncharacterized protein LOC143037480 isoform X1 [Oratosquilla oratoria]|uniref:uncharacterized protein LOC143037480 isoform X1 n=1 Tax=Oratosquilla oratoria TaxID=337810 RepID=UPI003F7723A1
MPVPNQELRLPVIPTDFHSFHDSFIEESRRNFNKAVKDLTNRCRLSSTEHLSSSRNLGQRDHPNDDREVSITDETSARKITIDVKDFKDGELSVKVVDNDMVVEGHVERKEGGSSSTRNFCQKFPLPETVDLEAITSTISSDGILTIKAPKNKHLQTSNSDYSSLNNTENSSEVNSVKSSTTNVSNGESQTESHRINNQDRSSSSTQTRSSPKLNTGEQLLNSDEPDDTKDKEAETPLPLIVRGSFFDDSFFSHVNKDFEAAMDSVLRSHDTDNCSLEARQQRRSLHEDKLTDETQAVIMSEDDTYHKIVLDVQDFKDGDVQVKGVGRSIVVEGKVEKNSGGSVSSRNFRRSFDLPSQAQHSDVTAALSSEGILTILVKKQPETPKIDEVEIPIKIDSKTEHRGIATGCNQVSSEKAKENVRNVVQLDKDALEQKHSSQASNQQKESNFTKEVQHKIEVDEQSKALNSQVQNDEQDIEKNNQSKNEKTSISATLRSGETTTSQNVSLPIQSRGDFFQDSFFNDDHKHFQSAVSKVLERFGMNSTVDEDLKTYRTLPKSISIEESQAAQITDGETNYKVVMDVRDFVKEDLQVKVDGQKLMVEGRAEKKEANSSSSRSFHRNFTLPTTVDIEAVTSALSSDGVLTITAPKRRNSSVCFN